MSDELKAAAEAIAWIEHNRNTSVQWDLDAYREFYERDVNALLPLANSYLAVQAAREAEAAERAKAIDEAWLLSIGFESETFKSLTYYGIQSKFHIVHVRGGKVFLANRGDPFIQIGVALTTTRGMMRDFLAGLLIPVKDGGK